MGLPNFVMGQYYKAYNMQKNKDPPIQRGTGMEGQVMIGTLKLSFLVKRVTQSCSTRLLVVVPPSSHNYVCFPLFLFLCSLLNIFFQL